jgi:F0F1-type ATP synthase membrane subunit b/b'
MREDAESTRTDLLARIADTEASLQLSISIASDVAHAAEWNCTMQLDTFDEHLRADLATMHNALSQELAASKEMIGSRMKCTSRALHLLQKLMCRPDGAQLFAEFDTDGDGSVSREELKQGYAKLGEYLSEEDMDAIMALVDQDGDGSMGYEEFVQMGKMTEDVEALRMTMQESLAQLKAESEETMAEKIIPLEESLATTRKDLEHTLSHTITEIESTIDETRTDLTGQVDTLRSDLKGACFATTCMSRPLILRYCFWLCSPTVSLRRCHRCSILGPCSNY